MLLTALSFTLLAGCNGDYIPPDGPAPTSGQRVTISTIHFDKWIDYLVLQAAVDDDCNWLYPLADDDSVPYPPLQVYWVIYEDADDVTHDDEILDTYFIGDGVFASDFTTKDGSTSPESDFADSASRNPLGFQFPTAFQSSFLTVKDTTFLDDGYTMEAVLGKPIDATIRGTATPNADGQCDLEVTLCPRQEDCDDDDFSPLNWIYMELSFLLTVQEKYFRANEPPVDDPSRVGG